jgi:rhodanese-related sulfurtransferase
VTYWPPANVPEVQVDQLAAARDRGAPVVDVREPEEYEAGHVPGAVLIPLGQVVARVEEIPRDGPVYVICQTGGRSTKATQWLRSQGVDARNVAGGTKAWVESGKPTATGLDAG